MVTSRQEKGMKKKSDRVRYVRLVESKVTVSFPCIPCAPWL